MAQQAYYAVRNLALISLSQPPPSTRDALRVRPSHRHIAYRFDISCAGTRLIPAPVPSQDQSAIDLEMPGRKGGIPSQTHYPPERLLPVSASDSPLTAMKKFCPAPPLIYVLCAFRICIAACKHSRAPEKHAKISVAPAR